MLLPFPCSIDFTHKHTHTYTPTPTHTHSRDDPNYYRTVYDAVNDRTVVLSDRDLELIRRMQRGAFAHPEFEAYPPQVRVCVCLFLYFFSINCVFLVFG
jgi:hypothetical protein